VAEIGLPTKEIATLLDLTVARIGQLAKDGIITKNEDGTYSATVIPEYIRWLRRPTRYKDKDYTKLLEKEKHREKKRQNDIEEKKVAPVSLLTIALEKAGNIIIPILETLPLIMKRNFPEITGDQIQLVKKSIAECRNAVADMEIDLDD